MNTDVQKIVPSLWFNKQCEEAMNFYVSAFQGISGERKNSKIISIKRYEEGMETPGIQEMVGKVLTGVFDLEGYRFIALDGGPEFQINPSVSFILNFDPSIDNNARKNLDKLWERLAPEGKVLMDLQEYSFSDHYGWIQDKYGVSWQLFLAPPNSDPRPFIVPSLMFTGDVSGKAEEAMDFYLSVFNNSRRGTLERYTSGMDPEKEGTVMYSDFKIEGQWFSVMDSAHEHGFSFNEAISFQVTCIDQAELDMLWNKLTFVPEAEVCGWLKDKYGLSWQIIPEKLIDLITNQDKEKANRVLNTMLQMKKIVIKDLEMAYA